MMLPEVRHTTYYTCFNFSTGKLAEGGQVLKKAISNIKKTATADNQFSVVSIIIVLRGGDAL